MPVRPDRPLIDTNTIVQVIAKLTKEQDFNEAFTDHNVEKNMLLMEPVEPEEGIYIRPLVSNEEAPSPTLQAAIADVYKIFVGNDAVQLAN
jgi:hypothetical protein